VTCGGNGPDETNFRRQSRKYVHSIILSFIAVLLTISEHKHKHIITLYYDDINKYYARKLIDKK